MKYLRNNRWLQFITLAVCLAATIILSNYCVAQCQEREDDEFESEDMTSENILFSIVYGDDVDECVYSPYYTEDYWITDVNELFSDETDNGRIVYYSGTVHYDEKRAIDEILSEMNATGYFSNAEEDSELYADELDIPSVATDSYMVNEWYLDAINAKEAWKTLDKAPGTGVVVAVIDTGVNYTHGDLRKSMWVNEEEAYGIPGYDDDGNGVVDDIYGANFTTENASRKPGQKVTSTSANGDPSDTDEDGHGTHVAGIIAMTAANGGGCGVAYGAKIMAVKAGNADGSFSVSRVISAFNYAVDNGADVINMSFGTSTESSVFKAALQKASEKCVLVAAAGNDGKATSDSGYTDAENVFPAAYPFVLGVMATDKDNNVTSWSNYDYGPCTEYDYEIAAPGYNILSTVLNSRYNYLNGTSMAAPMVSAAAAVIMGSIDRDKISDPVKYTWGQLTQATKHTATRVDKDGVVHTYPQLNLYDSLNTEPSVSLRIGNNSYYDTVSGTSFDDRLEISQGNAAEIYCGFGLDNLWSAAENVTVSVSTTSDVCSIGEASIHLNTMPSCSRLSVACDDYESLSFSFNGRSGGNYAIPLKFKVTGHPAGSDAIYEKEYTDTVSISVAGELQPQSQMAVPGGTVITDAAAVQDQAGVQASVASLSAPEPSITSDDGKTVNIAWDMIDGAAGYYVYRSLSPEGEYTKMTTLSSQDTDYFTDSSITVGKKYYYKIQAYAADGTAGVMGNAGYVTVPARVKGVSSEAKPHGNKKKVVISWKRTKGARKYVVYLSSKKKSGYKKIVTTAKTTCTYTVNDNKYHYFKIRAYAGSSSGKAYGKYSVALKIKL